jgi:hypothetical protein
VGLMSKHRINTTISTKHWEILKKHFNDFKTQQKVLEAALESLEKSSRQNSALSQEEHDFLHVKGVVKSSCIIHRDILEVLIDTANLEKVTEVIINQNLGEHLIAQYCKKPLKKCSFKEILDGFVFFTRSGNITDSINYTEEGNYYILRIVHSLNIKFSKMLETFINSLFEEYGVKNESEISEKVIFIKIYKN